MHRGTGPCTYTNSAKYLGACRLMCPESALDERLQVQANQPSPPCNVHPIRHNASLGDDANSCVVLPLLQQFVVRRWLVVSECDTVACRCA